MADYRLNSDSSVTRTADGALIPAFSGNRDWDAYQVWLAAGNKPDPYVVPPVTLVTSLEFRRLFTQAERISVTQAGFTDPQIRVFMDDASSAGTVNLADPETVQGFAYLVSKSLLTQDRANQILAGTPPS